MKKMYIFDFDGCLVNSPLPEPGKLLFEKIKKEKYKYSGWWGRPESLLPEYDIKPLKSILPHYNRATEDFNSNKVLLTNRMYRLKPNILPILEKNRLYFHHHSFKFNNLSKVERAIEIIQEHYPDVTEVEFFDDMIEHVEDFTRMWELKPDVKLTIHFVSEDRDWIRIESINDFLKIKETWKTQ